MHSAVKAYHKVCKMDLRDRLILEHLYFVRHILGRMLSGLPDSVDNDNLESAGILGLVESAGSMIRREVSRLRHMPINAFVEPSRSGTRLPLLHFA